MIRIAIAEDDQRFLSQLQTYIRQYEQERGIQIAMTSYSDGDAFVEQYHMQFDLILMDIEMPLLDGISAAKLIRERDRETIIIFLTNMPQYAIRGYEVNAMDYILKPIAYFPFSQCLDKAIEQIQRAHTRYLLVSGLGNTQKIDCSRIYYIESQNRKIVVSTKNGNFVSTDTLRQLENELPSGFFFKCNRGCIINLEHVTAVHDNCVIVNGQAMPISRGKKPALMTALTDYVNGI